MGRVLVPTVCLEGFGIIFENQSSHQTKAFTILHNFITFSLPTPL